MSIVLIFFACVLSVFATTVMGYISMAMPIGPWIAPTVVLLTLLLFNLFRMTVRSRSITLITVASSIGGILATGFGFSFPALYFIDPALFTAWMAAPTYFALTLTCLALSAGALSMCIANALEGIDFKNPGQALDRSGEPVKVPRVVGPIRRTAPVCVDDVRFLRSLTDRPIKYTIPGPFTMAQQAQNDFYETDAAMALDYAAAVNEELRDLCAAGADIGGRLLGTDSGRRSMQRRSGETLQEACRETACRPHQAENKRPRAACVIASTPGWVMRRSTETA